MLNTYNINNNVNNDILSFEYEYEPFNQYYGYNYFNNSSFYDKIKAPIMSFKNKYMNNSNMDNINKILDREEIVEKIKSILINFESNCKNVNFKKGIIKNIFIKNYSRENNNIYSVCKDDLINSLADKTNIPLQFIKLFYLVNDNHFSIP